MLHYRTIARYCRSRCAICRSELDDIICRQLSVACCNRITGWWFCGKVMNGIWSIRTNASVVGFGFLRECLIYFFFLIPKLTISKTPSPATWTNSPAVGFRFIRENLRKNSWFHSNTTTRSSSTPQKNKNSCSLFSTCVITVAVGLLIAMPPLTPTTRSSSSHPTTSSRAPPSHPSDQSTWQSTPPSSWNRSHGRPAAVLVKESVGVGGGGERAPVVPTVEDQHCEDTTSAWPGHDVEVVSDPGIGVSGSLVEGVFEEGEAFGEEDADLSWRVFGLQRAEEGNASRRSAWHGEG